MDQNEDDVLKYEASTAAQMRKEDNQMKYIRKLQNLIFWQLDLLKQHELELKNRKDQTNTASYSSNNKFDDEKIKNQILAKFYKIQTIKSYKDEFLDSNTLKPTFRS